MEQVDLLIIDSQNNSPEIQLLQHQEGVALTIANNENEALIVLLYTHFDLILLDENLANSEIISFIKGEGGLNYKTPVYVMSEHQESYLQQHLLALGIEGCINKPLSVSVFEQLLIQNLSTDTIQPDYVQILLNKTQNNKNLALTIFKKLFAELPQQLIDIRNALQNHQYQSALDVTHKLHGSVGFCGFTDIQQPAYELENCLLHQDYPSVTGNFSSLKTAILNFTAQESTILDDIG